MKNMAGFLTPLIRVNQAARLMTLQKALTALLSLFVAVVYFPTAVSAEATTANDSGLINFQHRNLFPEGMDWDEKNGRFLLGSLGTGSLFTVFDSGKLELFVRDEDYAGRYALLGVKVDRKRNRVLAVVHNSDLAVPSFDAVVAYDLDTKARVLFARLDAVGAREGSRPVANDLTVDAAGNVYVTNSAGNFIWKVTSSGDVSVFTEDSLLSSQPLVTSPSDPATPCGLNGIVYHYNDYLLVGQSNTGALFKVHLPDKIQDRVHLVRTPRPLAAADGMAFRSDGALAVVSSSKAWLLTSSDDWRSAALADELPLNAPSFATSLSIRNAVKMYVLYSHLPDHTQGISRDDFSIQHLEFPKDAFDDPIWLILVIVLMVVLVLGWRFQMGHFFREYKRKRL